MQMGPLSTINRMIEIFTGGHYQLSYIYISCRKGKQCKPTVVDILRSCASINMLSGNVEKRTIVGFVIHKHIAWIDTILLLNKIRPAWTQ